MSSSAAEQRSDADILKQAKFEPWQGSLDLSERRQCLRWSDALTEGAAQAQTEQYCIGSHTLSC